MAHLGIYALVYYVCQLETIKNGPWFALGMMVVSNSGTCLVRVKKLGRIPESENLAVYILRCGRVRVDGFEMSEKLFFENKEKVGEKANCWSSNHSQKCFETSLCYADIRVT